MNDRLVWGVGDVGLLDAELPLEIPDVCTVGVELDSAPEVTWLLAVKVDPEVVIPWLLEIKAVCEADVPPDVEPGPVVAEV